MPRRRAHRLEGLTFIRQHPDFSFLMAMTFFQSFFGLACITPMPVLVVDILHVGARGQGLLMGVGGAAALPATLRLSARRHVGPQGWLIIGGGVLSGLAALITAPLAIAVGGFAVAAFAIGAAMMNREVRHLGCAAASGGSCRIRRARIAHRA